MSRYTGKPCVCGAKKGASFAHKKYCGNCQKTMRKSRSSSSAFARILITYNITEEQYWAIYNVQGGKCALCWHSMGKSRRLSVDHDHACCDGPKSCGKCVRGLLCVNCNRNVLGRAARDDPEFFIRGWEYLNNPPAYAVIQRD